MKAIPTPMGGEGSPYNSYLQHQIKKYVVTFHKLRPIKLIPNKLKYNVVLFLLNSLIS